MRTRIAALVASLALANGAAPLPARAEEKPAEKDIQQKLDALTKEIEGLKRQQKKDEERSLSRWLTVGGDYRFRIDSLHGAVPEYYQYTGPTTMPVLTPGFHPSNDSIMTNRFGLNLKAKATEDVTITTRLVMYKTFGMQTDAPVDAGYFADRSFILDGTVAHVPANSILYVDQVFATWNNIASQPIWFSVGRRPSTGGAPTNVRENLPRPGNSGVPGLLVDYAFDGMTLGVAPDIDFLPGAYAKVCYGRGFESGFNEVHGLVNHLADTEMAGVQVVPLDTDKLRVDFQWNRGFDIFDNPNNVGQELGDIDWYGVNLLSTLKGVGPGALTSFVSGGMSQTHPNGRHALLAGPGSPDSGAGLLANGTDKSEQLGYSIYAGFRYDLPSGTKLGGEYNHGTKYWIPFDPAADDLWTSKLGTRGNVYEVYLIQELPLKPIASFLSKTFFKIGYQYYDFTWTGSNNWIGAPVRTADLGASPFNAQMLAPVKSAHDVYGTFEVRL